eukprot:1157456-Pelagomonas_calceolata.AAC.10
MQGHKSTSFHPQSDGQTGRINRVLEDMLRHYVSPLQDDRDDHLAMAEFAFDNLYQESVKNTPFRLNNGRDPRTPLSWWLKVPFKVPAVTSSLSAGKTWSLQKQPCKLPSNAKNITLIQIVGLLTFLLVMKSKLEAQAAQYAQTHAKMGRSSQSD